MFQYDKVVYIIICLNNYGKFRKKSKVLKIFYFHINKFHIITFKKHYQLFYEI